MTQTKDNSVSSDPAARVEYCRQLLALWRERSAGISESYSERFRRFDEDKWKRLYQRAVDENSPRERELNEVDRAALRVLDTTPDLLSPMGMLTYEPAHSQLLAYFMNRSRVPERLAMHLLRDVYKMIGRDYKMDDERISDAKVSTEVSLSNGRVDIGVRSRSLHVFIEVKIYASEGPSQLLRYGKELDQREDEGFDTDLILLTLCPAENRVHELEYDRPGQKRVYHHIAFHDLLPRWLPYACLQDHASAYLASYLSSVARLLGYKSITKIFEFATRTPAFWTEFLFGEAEKDDIEAIRVHINGIVLAVFNATSRKLAEKLGTAKRSRELSRAPNRWATEDVPEDFRSVMKSIGFSLEHREGSKAVELYFWMQPTAEKRVDLQSSLRRGAVEFTEGYGDKGYYFWSKGIRLRENDDISVLAEQAVERACKLLFPQKQIEQPGASHLPDTPPKNAMDENCTE
ncbi:MAG: PD-(D/E)XK nuclease family protein [Polyangiaceae bacterium]|nr:PD-(D/E)XK nuclease family protein [Polyangiaceae bacterium]